MFDIILLSNTAETNQMKKSPYLKSIGLARGTLRDDCSVLNPSFIIESIIFTPVVSQNKRLTGINTDMGLVGGNRPSNTGILKANYCYIPIFKRYYFINDIISVAGGLWQINLNVDVLYSWVDEIENLKGFVSRCQYDYNLLLPDNKIPCQVNNILTYYEFSTLDEVMNLLVNYDTLLSTEACYLLVTASSTPYVSLEKFSPYYGNCNLYILNSVALKDFLTNLLTNTVWDDAALLFNNPQESLIKLSVLPCDINSIKDLYYIDPEKPLEQFSPIKTAAINMGKTSVSVPDTTPNSAAYRLNSVERIVIPCGGVQLSNNFTMKSLFYNPYSKAELYLPMVGYVPIDTQGIVNKKLYLFLCYDAYLGVGTYVLKANMGVNLEEAPTDFNDLIDIAEFPAKVGIDIPINGTNIAEISRNIFTGVLKIGSALLTKGASLSLSGLSREEKQFMGGAVAGSTAMSGTADFISSTQNHITKGNGGVGADNLISVFSPFIVVESPNSLIGLGNIGDYAHNYGIPINQYKKISDVSGYFEMATVIDKGLTCTDVEKEEIVRLLKSGVHRDLN